MSLCWSQEPQDRPSASVIGDIARRQEFCHLYQAVSLDEEETVICAVCAPHVETAEDWLECKCRTLIGQLRWYNMKQWICV